MCAVEPMTFRLKIVFILIRTIVHVLRTRWQKQEAVA